MHSFAMHNDGQGSCADVLPGTLQMLILKTLTRGPLHGYAIAQQIKLTSDDVLQVEEGSLYPALQRMLLKGWMTAEWVQAGPKRRARVYRLTPAGRKQLADDVSAFTRVMDATRRIIQPA
jgi:PadR family transcriptional regulator, regulatory protein PadR